MIKARIFHSHATTIFSLLLLCLKFDETPTLKGINYITDSKGNKTAVVISLKDYKEEIEDFLDGLDASSRLNEPSVDFEKAINKIIKSKSSRGKVRTKAKEVR